MTLIDLSGLTLIAPAGVPQDAPPEVLAAARGVFELADSVDRRKGNPFADLANQDDEDLDALYERVRARFEAARITTASGAEVAP